ncbi:MAG: hypothetical protein RLZZ283_268, partial [Candidatus Parcubacteria bacterium]
MTFIVVEGIDGVGKSTFAKELSSRLRARYVTSVPSHLLGMKRFVDAYASAATHYMFYRYCIHATSKKIRQHLRRGETVVADRYWYTTVATHRTLGVPCRSSDFASVVQPDVVYFVTASEDVRVQRMVRRGLDANDVRMRDTATA